MVDGVGASTRSPTSWLKSSRWCFLRGVLAGAGLAPVRLPSPADGTAGDHVERTVAHADGNGYGRDGAERAQVLSDLDEVEPLLRRSADLVLTTTVSPAVVADRLLEAIATRLTTR